uniref:Uncharacterized protein n=2 Tax=Wuchereria bancrofti TaxID=6293 RepID=A0AAF5PSH3_WUCBA
MHNRIEDVRSSSDDNGDIVKQRSTDMTCLDGIDTRKYADFLNLYNSLKKRNASPVNIDHTRHLASVQRGRSRYRNVSAVDDSIPSTSSQQSSATSQNSNDEHVLGSYQLSRESQPSTLSDMDLTKTISGTASFEQSHRFNNNTAQSTETVMIGKDAVTRSLSFDANCTTTGRNCFERNSDLDVTTVVVQKMDDKNPIHINSECTDFNLRNLSEKNNIHSELFKKKEVSFCETSSTEIENYVDADKLQEIKTLRNINKTLAKKLAKAERIAQLLQIQLKFYDKTSDAKFACKLADVIDQLKLLLPNDRFRDEALKVLNSATPSVDINDEKSVFLNNLLKEIEYDKATLSNSGTLRKYCERLVEYARKHPPVLMELQNQINEIHILQLRNSAEYEIMMKNNSNGNIIDGSCENHQRQITSLEANLVLHREQLAMKDVQLRQLEEEIGNAHRCNQQLNAKLGSMVTANSTNFLNQEKELRKALKERTSECDSLRKKVEKFERDRQQWENQKRALEAKQPMDVQMLQGQKRELTMQLDREQAEKQELFMQINSLIAQLADANRVTSDQQECNVLKDENEKLKKQITDILAVQSQLNTDVHNLQEEVRCKNQEVENAQDESKRLRLIMNNEKVQLESSIEELQRDLQMKSAALQSLMLAKQDIKTNEADPAMITQLTAENEELRGQIDEIRNEIKGRVSEIEEVKSDSEKKLRNLQSELDFMRENAKKKEAELSKQSDEIGKLQSELNSALETIQKGEAELSSMRNNEVHEISQLRGGMEKYKLDAEKLSERLEESQKNLVECEKKYDALKKDTEAKITWENSTLADTRKKFEEEIRQQEIKHNDLKQSLKMEGMRAQEAEQEAKSCRLKIIDLEEELNVLRIQTDKQRSVDEQVRLLREELKQARNKISAQAADLEKAEIDADEADRSSRETIDELEEEVRSLQEKLKILEIGEEEQSKRLLVTEQEMMRNQENSEKYEKKCKMLTKELEEVRTAFADTSALLEIFKAENEKLSAKASLEDEVLTLATSLQSARDEISIKHDEIAKLRKELRELREENERLLMDIDVQTQALQQDAQLARSECDEMRKEMEKCKSDNVVQQQKNDVILVELRNEISRLKEQVIEKERMLTSVQSDLESKHQKMLIETKQQYEQKIAELNKEVGELKASESGKINELNAVMTNLRKELAVKGGSVASFRIDQHHEFQNSKTQNLDLSPRSDFEEKLTTLKECIADVLEEKLLFEQSDYQLVLVNKATQTKAEMEEGRHIISVNNDDEEEAVKHRDKDAVLLKLDDRNCTSRSCVGTSEQIWKSKSSSEVWGLRAELAFLKKQMKDEEMDRKCLQKRIQVLQATIQENKEVLGLIKETEKDVKSDKLETEGRLDPFEEQIGKLRKELMSVQECREQYKREIEERDLDITGLKKDIENLTSDMRSYKTRLQESSRLEERNRVIEFENKNLLDECTSLKANLTKLKEQFVEMENENNRKHIEKVKDLDQQLDKAHQAYELSRVEMDRLREQSENLSKEVNYLRNFLNIANTEKEQLKTEALERLKEMERLSCERMELEVTRQQLDEAIAEGERQAQELASLKVQTKNSEDLERDRQQELHDLREQIQTIEENWKMECNKSEAITQAAEKELEKLTKTNETFVEDIRRLTNELEVERKRIIDLGMEKMHLSNEVGQLRNEVETLKTKNVLDEDSPDVKNKLNELMAENAQLAGELLKEHNLLDKELSKQDQQMEGLLKKHWKSEEKLLLEKNREELRKLTEDFERRLQQCNEEWKVKSNNQLEILNREMQSVKDENKELLNQNERMRKEMGEMQQEMKKSKQVSEELDIGERLKKSDDSLSRLETVCNTPTPPPRKRIGSEITDEILQVSLAEENKKLKKDIDMQHRLVVVLRRKLQSMQQQQQQQQKSNL